MDDLHTARRNHCARCQRPVLICRHCDRGQLYCFEGCHEAAQRERCRRNSQNYQYTPKGRRNNAQRQHRHRERKRWPSVQDAIDSGAAEPSVETPDAPVHQS